jgi:hypothetical protein
MLTSTAIHAPSKSRYAESERRRAIGAVRRAAVGLPRLLPVIYGGRVTAWCGWSDVLRQSVVWEHRPWMDSWVDRDGLLAGYAHVDDVINNVTTNLQLQQIMWQKENGSTTPSTGWAHVWNVQGYPAAASWGGAALTAVQKSDSTLGSMPHGGNVSPATKHVLSGWLRVDTGATATDPLVACLYDMVLTYENCANSNSLQTFTNTLAAQRYVGGGDPGLRIMAAFASTSGTNTAFSQLRYTSVTGSAPQHQVVPGPAMTTPVASAVSSGNAGMSALGMTNTNVRSILEAPLVNGDSGVKQLDDYTMGATNSDTITFVLGFHLAWLATSVGDYVTQYDFVKQAPALPRVRDGACLAHALYLNGSNLTWQGGYACGWA